MIMHGNKLADNETEVEFAGDTPDGGWNVECQTCKTEMPHTTDVCPICGKILVVRPWYEW